MNCTLHSQTRYWKAALSIMFAITLYLFWLFVYPAHLAFQEQLQLFLYDADYFHERISTPGGLSVYIADFLTQFYYHPWVGAIILSLLIVVLQRLTWTIAKQQGTQEVYYPLSFLPAIAMWHYMGDENGLLAYLISLICALISVHGYHLFGRRTERMAYLAVIIPTLYWVAGPVHFILAFWGIVCEIKATFRNRFLFQGIAISTTIILFAFACPLLSSNYVQYAISRLMTGIEYYRFPRTIPFALTFSLLITMITPLAMSLLPAIKKQQKGIITLQIVLLILGGGWFVKSGCHFDKEEAIRYDLLAYRGRWKEIIAQAEKEMPTTPQSVTCLNLALGMTGQLSNRMFEFYQNGTNGLIYPFNHNIVSSLCVSEVHYRLGMISAAQQITFEVMTSTPNNMQNARCIKRLAETNLINGKYEVAAKYLRTLQKTLYYKRWANHVMSYLYNEERINNHPTWGWLRKISHQEDFLYSGNKMSSMLGLLFQQNHQNQLAYEYLMAYQLLQGDLQHFVEYFPLIQFSNYKQIPRSYQEALAFVWAQENTNFDNMPWNVSNNVKQAMSDFIKLYRASNNQRDNLLKERYGKTFWYYITNRNQP